MVSDKNGISVIIPVYNEKETVENLIRCVTDSCRTSGLRLELIIVDDGSTDGTKEILDGIQKTLRCRVLFKEKNEGKGSAIRQGIKLAREDIVLIQDADLEYDPGQYPLLLGPIIEGRSDVVYGSRFMRGSDAVIGLLPLTANKLLTAFSNMITGLRLTDMETCYKIFKKEVIQDLVLTCNGFDFEAEVTVKLANRKARFAEVPIRYRSRSYREGKKIGFWDALHTIWALIRFSVGR